MKLEMTQKQELKLTPQMLQSMEILQMSTQELEAYLQELVQENPAAELSEPEERPDEGEELWRRMQSLADQDNQNRQYVAAEREELDPLARIGTDGGLEVHLQESRLPGLRLSRFYCDMYRDDPDPEVRQYLDGKIRQAQWAIQAVEQRRATLLRCAQVLVRRQEAFFQGPGGSLTSLRLADVAAELSIHESTVSRAVREKYLQCARGVYPLSFFFPREVGAGEGQSAHEIKNQLLQLIREEDKSRPCSDQKLCQLLAEEGYAVSRRTVAKYREELGVSSAVGRRA